MAPVSSNTCWLLPIAVSSAFQQYIRRDNLTGLPGPGYHLFHSVDPDKMLFYAKDPENYLPPFEVANPEPPDSLNTSISPGEVLVFTYIPQSSSLQTSTASQMQIPSEQGLVTLWRWLHKNYTLITVPSPLSLQDQCLGVRCSPNAVCKDVWTAIYFDNITRTNENEYVIGDPSIEWQCEFFLDRIQTEFTGSDSESPGYFSNTLLPCSNDLFTLNEATWAELEVDDYFPVLLQGGSDQDGILWRGALAEETFSDAVNRQLLNLAGTRCSIEAPCLPALDCSKIGSWTAIALGSQFIPLSIPWAFLAISALKNINQQLLNQYNELKDALESLALDTFSIDDFFPKKGQDFDLLNGLAGLSGIFSILGGLIPYVGPAISAAGTIASGAGTFLSNSVAATTDPLRAQKTFAEKVIALYRQLLNGLDDAVTQLFEGRQIGDSQNSFNITDMMKGGAWVNPKVISKVSDLNAKVRIEVLSRSINALWKTWSSNKMWVLFTDLQDPDTTKCQADTTGPGDSKYCADGGVDYTYNFVEHDEEGGGVSYPWGAQNLPTLNIPLPWVTKASALSYQAMKDAGLDPFNFSPIAGLQSFIDQVTRQVNGSVDLAQFAGQYPGSWTLPVCNASWWGKAWNWDYAQNKDDVRGSTQTHPPCICGKFGLRSFFALALLPFKLKLSWRRAS